MSSTLRAALLAAVTAIEDSREALCRLDSAGGDGDHGVTMAIGARRTRQQLDVTPTDGPAELMRAAATGMAGAGGTIGAVYGAGLLAVVAGLEARTTDGSDVAVLAAAAGDAVQAVSDLGAKPGDKTVLDALLPVASALAAASSHGVDLPAALAQARAAAAEGAESTAVMVARVGRAARFPEKSVGSVDAGAASLAIIIAAMVGAALPTAD